VCERKRERERERERERDRDRRQKNENSELVEWLKWWSTCLVQTLVTPKKKKKKAETFGKWYILFIYSNFTARNQS
jgi:hypothetical protein